MHMQARHIVSEHPEYFVCLDDFRSDSGDQMVLMHIDVDAEKFTPDVMRRMLREWGTLRQCTGAPLYAIEPNPDDRKWERFVRAFGFHDTDSRVECTDGMTRRLFVSLPEEREHGQVHNDRQRDQ